jgi:hypothetical protein
LRVVHLDCRYDSRLAPRLRNVVPLTYAAGGSRADDLVDHVRAASAVRNFGGRLLIVQDDVRALAIRDKGGITEAVLLRPGRGGTRTFDDVRGNKRLKLDLEACVVLPDGRAVILGSGSRHARERLVVVGQDGSAQVRRATELYRQLRSVPVFVGTALNIEGAVYHRGKIRLFQRGNGLAAGRQAPVNAIGDLELATFLAWLDGDGPVPSLLSVTTVDLGATEGVAFGFTDGAVLADDRLAFVACAEATSDVTSDGPVVGVRFGLIDDSGSVRVADVTGADGRPTRYKLEGVESRPGEPGRLDVVADLDAPDEPALLAELVYSDP